MKHQPVRWILLLSGMATGLLIYFLLSKSTEQAPGAGLTSEMLEYSPKVQGGTVPLVARMATAPAPADVAPVPEDPAEAENEEPAPVYPFNPDAPLPLPTLNISALTDPSILAVFLRNNAQVNPARLPFTKEECKKLLYEARTEVEQAHRAQIAFGEEIENAVQRGREKYNGSKFNSFQEAAEYSRSIHRGTRLAKIVIARIDGAMASVPIIVDPVVELDTYLRYKAMLDGSELASARIRQLIASGAYR